MAFLLFYPILCTLLHLILSILCVKVYLCLEFVWKQMVVLLVKSEIMWRWLKQIKGNMWDLTN
jgi:hypothetical protein